MSYLDFIPHYECLFSDNNTSIIAALPCKNAKSVFSVKTVETDLQSMIEGKTVKTAVAAGPVVNRLNAGAYTGSDETQITAEREVATSLP
jgi:hypothetical protein